MSLDANSLVREAIKKSKVGDKVGARELLEQATEVDPNNEKAWLWLSGVVDSPDDQRVCLENVLYLNPNNENAKRGLQILDQRFPQTAAPDPEPPTPSASVDESVWNDIDTGTAEPAGSTSPFTIGLDDFDDVFADAFEDDSDPFADDVFATDDASSLLDDDTDLFDDSADMGVDDLFEQDTFVSDSDSFSLDDDMGSSFDEPFESVYDTDDSLYATEADDSFDSLSGSGIFGDLDDATEADVDSFMDMGVGAVDEADPSYYFRQIPKKIKVTRMPGKRGLPVLSLIVFLILIAANVGAVMMLTSGS